MALSRVKIPATYTTVVKPATTVASPVQQRVTAPAQPVYTSAAPAAVKPSATVNAVIAAVAAPKPAISTSSPATPAPAKASSPVIAPAFIAKQVLAGPVAQNLPPELASPGVTRPAANPYAADAAWTEFPESTTIDPFDEPAATGSSTALIQTTETTAKVVQPSWFDRFLSMLGLSRKSAVSATMAGEAASMASMSQSEAAAQLVRRSRNGDQNAMAMIVCVRDAAAKGNGKAKMSAKLMMQYIKAHPVGDDPSVFGIDDVIPRSTPQPSDPATAAAVALSHGPLLSNPRIEEFVRHAGFGAEEISAFQHGMAGRPMRNPDLRIQKANKFGALMAHARKLQAVRMKDSPVSKFDANIGWELGEDLDIK